MIPIGETKDGRADMTNFEMDLFDTRVSTYPAEKEVECCKNSVIKPACLPVTIIAALLMVILFMPVFNDDMEVGKRFEKTGVCTDACRLEIVESIPTNLTYKDGPVHTATHLAWLDLLRSAEKSVHIAALYWNLRDTTGYPTAKAGQQVYDELVATAKRGVRIQIAQNNKSRTFPQTDSEDLGRLGLAEVQSLDFPKLFGSGVLHTKFWIIDGKHIYVGSANMDWRSLTEVKELGVVIRDCSCMAVDLQKIFTIYWKVAEAGSKLPVRWPLYLRTKFNHEHPLNITFNGVESKAFISNSPTPFNPEGRDHDLDAIVAVMDSAKDYVRVAVMDYIPSTLYMGFEKNYYWAGLDNALRATAYRGLRVDLLISQWNYSRPEMLGYLRSMLTINSVLPRHAGGRQGKINVKLFTVPTSAEQSKLDHARVNHNKYMVTDRAAYVGTSNWAGDYFLTTAGVGLIIQEADSPTIVADFNAVYERDWTSEYATELPPN